MKMKKALIGTMMAGALVIGAGASTGTYSDFFSEANSAGNKIELGTLQLKETGNLNQLLEATNLQPGAPEAIGKATVIENVGSLKGILSVHVDGYSIKDKDDQPINPSDLSAYSDIKVGLYVNGVRKDPVSISELPRLYANLNAELAKTPLAKGTSYTIKPYVTVDKKSGSQNHLQGLKFSGDISWKLTQTN
ncbi:TasA family protein [Rossellomorea marisflavi]